MTYLDWLATLDEAQKPPASNQDSAAHADTAPLTFDSSAYNSPSNTYSIQKSETSADELALALYEPLAIPSKR